MKLDLTVIIPYYNESKTILKTLNLLSVQTYKPKKLIIYSRDELKQFEIQKDFDQD